MPDRSDAVLVYWNEQRQQLRQSENQRSTMTNFLLVIVAGLSGLIVQQKFVIATVALAALITFIGFYGALISAKYHERAQYHLTQARALTKELQSIGIISDGQSLDEFREAHYVSFPTLHRIRLHLLWTGLHLAIAVYGIALTIIIIAIA